ncbi:hypothetical protein [Streptomyces sp. NBC_00198]|uniref:hypothetical protein n=1 Tax=Streptomyces sp. NBC_00198 TaxID=2975677 RepID=UPI00224EDD72|nr:hypothetical protein [Streptomyces sp. NBC_00198]MCX5284086.1 hypothetical protein [Streptomyces sp. NBC_00198]
MAHFDVYISGEGIAEIDGHTLVPAPGQSVHEAVLDRLQAHAEERGGAVEATVFDGPDAARFVLRVLPDGSSLVLDPDEAPAPAPATDLGPSPHDPPAATAVPAPAPAQAEPAPVAQAPAPAPAPAESAPAIPAPAPAPAVAPAAFAPPVPVPVPVPAPAPVAAPVGQVAPAPLPIAVPERASAPAAVVVPPSAAATASAVATAVARARATAAARAEVPDPAAVTARAVRTDFPDWLTERIGRINGLAAAGMLDEAFDDATELREGLTESLGAEHPHAVEARAVEAYLAHLRGDHREAIVLALAVARIRCRARDGRAPAEVARAAAAWQQLDDDRAVVAHGRELLHMWATLERNGLLPPGYAALVGQVRKQVEALAAYV